MSSPSRCSWAVNSSPREDFRNTILSYQTWRDVFGADPDIIGKPIQCRQRPADRHRRGRRGLRVSRRHGDVDEDLHGAARPTAAALQPVGLRARAARPLLGSGAGASSTSSQTRIEKWPDGRKLEFVARPLLEDVVGDLRPTLLIVSGATALLLLDRLHQRGELAARARRGSLERVRAARGDRRPPVAHVSPAHDRELRALHVGRSPRLGLALGAIQLLKADRSRGSAAILARCRSTPTCFCSRPRASCSWRSSWGSRRRCACRAAT